MSLRAMHRRLDGIRAPAVALTIGDVIDRPPRETREEWIARSAARAAGRSYACDAVNTAGETFAQWEVRRFRELGVTGGLNEPR